MAQYKNYLSDNSKMQEAESGKNRPGETLRKRRVKMSDEKRYLIYYTFEAGENLSAAIENKLSENETQNSIVGEKIENV